jgi:hypothetical protein
MGLLENSKKISVLVARRPVLSKQNIHYFVNKPKTTVSLIDKTPGRKRNVLTEEKSGEFHNRLETNKENPLND